MKDDERQVKLFLLLHIERFNSFCTAKEPGKTTITISYEGEEVTVEVTVR